MNPGDRVILVSIRPQYLEGVRGTIVREQPGENRVLVKVDNDPKAKKYAGGEWCVDRFTCRPDPSEDNIFATLRDNIDPRCKHSAKTWLEDIAKVVNVSVDESAMELFLAHPDLNERWEDTYKPALLWRFYWHLSNELRLISEGHEKVLFTGLEEKR